MTDWRPYTGTQRLQLGLTALIAVLGLVVWSGLLVPVLGRGSRPVAVAVLGVVWLVGLLVVAFRHRRRWAAMVERSGFQVTTGTRVAALEKLVGGRSVTVTTDVPGLLAQEHTTVETSVQDVEASFTVRLESVGTEGTGDGMRTGVDGIDERFAIRGGEANVARLLSPEVQAALLDVDTPGTCTVTGEQITYEIPFTGVSAGELEAIATLLVTIAARVETLASS